MSFNQYNLKELKSIARHVNIKIRSEHKELVKSKVKAMRQKTREEIAQFKEQQKTALKNKLIPINKMSKGRLIPHLNKHSDKASGFNPKESDEIAKFEKDLAEELKDPAKYNELFGDLPKKATVGSTETSSRHQPKPKEKQKAPASKAPSTPFICDRCGKGSYTTICVKCMREDLKKAEAAEKNKKTVAEAKQAKSKVIEKIRKTDKKQKALTEKAKPKQEFITVKRGGRVIRMKLKKKEEEPAPDPAKVKRVEDEKKRRQKREKESAAQIAKRLRKKQELKLARAKDIKKKGGPKAIIAQAAKDKKALGKVQDRLLDLKMNEKDTSWFDNFGERLNEDEFDFKTDYSKLFRLIEKYKKKPEAKVESKPKAPAKPKAPVKPKAPAKPKAPVKPKEDKDVIAFFNQDAKTKQLVLKAMPEEEGFNKDDQKDLEESFIEIIDKLLNDQFTDEKEASEELSDAADRAVFMHMYQKNYIPGAKEYKKKKSGDAKAKADEDAQFQKEKDAIEAANKAEIEKLKKSKSLLK